MGEGIKKRGMGGRGGGGYDCFSCAALYCALPVDLYYIILTEFG